MQNNEFKQKGKDYADEKRNSKESNLGVGDRVLMQQPKQNKLSTRFAEKPVTVVEKSGSKVVVESDSGRQYTRNSALLRKFEEPVQDTSEVDLEDSDDDDNVRVPLGSSPRTVTRSGRTIRTPQKFKDFVMT